MATLVFSRTPTVRDTSGAAGRLALMQRPAGRQVEPAGKPDGRQ